jgi:hypothetical protein
MKVALQRLGVENPDYKSPGHPGWGLNVGLTTLLCKTCKCYGTHIGGQGPTRAVEPRIKNYIAPGIRLAAFQLGILPTKMPSANATGIAGTKAKAKSTLYFYFFQTWTISTPKD